MRRRHTRAAAAVTALVAGGLAVFALRPAPSKTATLAATNQPAEVRTVVTRRTIHIVRHQPTAGAGGSLGGGGAGHGATMHTGASGSHGYASAAAGAVTTHVSGSHTAGSSATPSVTTRTSPSHSGPGSSSGSSSAPITSRTTPHGGSRSGSGTGSSGGPVTSRTTPHGGSGGGGSVHTRTSGGREKGDHGGD